MAFDLSSLSDDAFDAEYHRRLSQKTPAEAGQKIAQTALISMGGNEVPNYPNKNTSPDVSQIIPQTPTAKFIGQRGEIVTRPYEDISNSYIDRRGQIRPTVIDARAPVAYGGALSAPSLTPDAEWQAKFQPSSDLQRLNDRRDTLNAASRVRNPGYDPVKDIVQLRNDNATYSTQQQNRIQAQQVLQQAVPMANAGGPRLASNEDYNAPQNDPFRKFFGGGIQTPTPTPTPSPPPKVTQETPYWRKKKDDESTAYYG